MQNLNKEFTLPLDDNSIDFVLIVAGWQYLQYPEEVASEIFRIVNERGKVIVSFSNRAFWNKTPRIWYESNDYKRISYVKDILVNAGFEILQMIHQVKQNKRLFELLGFSSDPFLSVIAEKRITKGNKIEQIRTL